MKIKQYLSIISFKTKAELKAERQRTHLGFVWWLLEPIMFLGIFYVVFSQLKGMKTENFVQFLLVGLIIWQWFSSSVLQANPVILYQINLLRQVVIPAWIFPIIKVSANTFKFIVVFLLLLLFLWITGFSPSLNYFYMVEVLLIQFILINGVVLCLASIVPFLPDISNVVENLMLGAFFTSGIFFPISNIPEPIQSYLYLNPMAIIITSSREILIGKIPPNQADLMYVLVIGVVLLAIGFYLFDKFQDKYPKLAES